MGLWRCSDFDCRGIINIDSQVPAAQASSVPEPPRAGESAQAEFERLRARRTERVRRMAPYLAAAGLLFSAGGAYLGLIVFGDVRFAGVAGLIVVVIFLWLLIRLPPEVLYWGQGAEAERAVGAKLGDLERHGFVTLFDRRVPGRGGNIDAVTVGPPGVFVVETKHRRRAAEVIQGRLEIGGRLEDDPINQVLDQALRVQLAIAQSANRSRLTVVPVLCIGNRKVEGDDRARGVLVLDARRIAQRLASEPEILDATAVQQLARELDRALVPFERRTG